jgi:hypothetical protein
MSYTFMVTVFLVNKRDGYIRPYELTEPQSKSTSCHYQMFIQKKKISPQGAQSRLGGVVLAYRIMGRIIENKGDTDWLKNGAPHCNVRRDYVDTDRGIKTNY